MPNPKPQSTYVVLDDSYEQEIRVDAKYKKQTTMEDKMWFGLEYTNKNTFLSKGTHFDEDTREKYGFNISGDEDENDKQKAEDLADKIYADSVKPDSLEDMTKYFQTLGTMKARMISLDGQYADSIEKALEGEEDKELKTQYLFTVGTENARMYSFSEYSYLAENSASSDLNNMIKDRIDLKTATYNDFAKAMNLDGIKIKNGDKKIYDDIKESFPNYNEIQIESKILESLRNTFVSWNKGIGEHKEYDNLTREQKELYKKASFIAEMKNSRKEVSAGNKTDFNVSGESIDSMLKKRDKLNSYIKDIVKDRKDINAVTEKIVDDCNKRFFVDTLRSYPKSTTHNEMGGKKGYDTYILLHTGPRGGKNPDEMADNLAKNLAAHSLMKLGHKFDIKEIHKTAEHIKEIYSIDALKSNPEVLKNSLKDYSAALKTGRELRNAIYGVPQAKNGDFFKDMETLSKSMRSPEGRSNEYRNFYEAVKNAATLKDKVGNMSAEEKAEAIRNANLNVFEAVKKYTHGKEKERIQQKGKDGFDNAMDAIAISTKYAPGMSIRTNKLLTEINTVRNNNDPTAKNFIDPKDFTERYGAKHAEDIKEAREAKETKPQKGDMGRFSVS